MSLLLIMLGVVFAFLVLLVVGTAAAVITVVRELPWLLIVVGGWLIWRAQRSPKRRRRRDVFVQRRSDAAPRSTARRTIEHQPRRARPEAPARRELPIDVDVRVEQIRRKADMLLGFADRFPPFSQDLHIVQQTAADYLPRTIEAYLALPGDRDLVMVPSGKTALDELRAQLQLLDSRLDDIAQDLQRQDLDRLLANRRFLEERFQLREREAIVEPAGRETDAA